MSTLPIEEYALLSDCHTAALVSRHGSVDWLCFPRFDAPALFARLLDSDAGHWSIRPASDDVGVERRYVGSSLVLESTFRAASGTVTLTDALAVGPNDRGHELGSRARAPARSPATADPASPVHFPGARGSPAPRRG